ncbi:hypothetical protein [Candidatus Contubernalis alkaliaceticus]|uniref:hypothetical protein n=1 Tax=Candidatus Contubernalis alkaliaceticus TaxID=338645 RepID=UPI001F4BFBBC|nr:hypothetical protein [Candidatus Contubernalis alkalaceticus]UNC91187.1 hypothetical protein HUE98_03245 [Candidatus Contubernalis alkalaceticus]
MRIKVSMRIKVIALIIGLLLLVGCKTETSPVTNEKIDNNPTEKEVAAVVDEKDKEPVKGLPPEYQILVDEITAAIEKGYKVEIGEVFTRQGDYVLMGNQESMLFSIGKAGGKGYMVQMANGEYGTVFENDFTDWVGFRLESLIRQLEAYSTNSLYAENEFHNWVVKEVEFDSSGNKAVIKVETQYDGKPDEEHTVETYTIVDGLLESFSVSSRYINGGELQEDTYDYISKGPIDGSVLAELYEEVSKFAN